jgi:iron complex transport system substrate-binding protein
VRIVSLLPAATEVLFAIGAGDDVVGVTFECDHPPEARRRRIVSTTTLPEGLSPAAIDAEVAARAAAGEDLYHLDAGALADLDADLVVSQDLCAVCAVPADDVDSALAHLGCAGQVLTVAPRDLASVLDAVVDIGRAAGAEAAARDLVVASRRRLDAVAAAVAGRPRVPTLVLEWTDPPWSAGHWIPEMVALAGGDPLLGVAGGRSERIGWDAVAAARPAAVVCAPCGFGLDAAAEAARGIRAQVALPAGCAIWAVDANAAFTRPGPRLVDGVEALAALLHPDALGPPQPAVARRIDATATGREPA